ncbi:PolC-type DNA polymerase III [Natranaerobius thermophilus]|uniref:DNA polymerase III PolC-type n=1 Tax=Natranaerobius thermophilus (strain ATCC BAA-1301 / DSM 18059 / JW/NM-WN-LF) TaxID=457570 RepID=B2A392_NATTJ|nr:PolC-type DNA polymerase III [Natranaerobius thermophilus]ACB85022.1 DNA polymerase III, alpha subunit [Natranaerobius thermophilus JW/NM-WN-LF]
MVAQELRDNTLKDFVNKCLVDQNRNRWILLLDSHCDYSYQEFYQISNNLLNRVTSLKEICFIILTQNNDVGEFLKNNKDNILLYLNKHYPSLYNCIHDIQLKEDKIELHFKNKANLELARKKGLPDLIQEFFYIGLEKTIPVKLTDLNINEVSDIEEENAKMITELQKEYQESQKMTAKTGQKKQSRQGNGQAIMGQVIKDEPISIAEIVEEERSVVVMGQVFDFETRELKSGRTLVIFNITDYSDSIGVKCFLNENQEVPDGLEDNRWLIVRGSVKTDSFSQELTIFPKDICPASNPYEREDTADEKRIELHAHTRMSTLDATCSATELVETAADWGHKAIAITDHGVVQSFPEAFEAAQEKGIKVLYGVECYLVEDEDNYKDTSYHCIVIAKNKQGLQDLYRLISESHLYYFYRFPRIPKKRLSEVRENLLIGSACERGEVIQALLNGKSSAELEEIAGYYDYLEIQPAGNNEFLIRKGVYESQEDLHNLIKEVVKLARKIDKPFCATSDVHFLHPWDKNYRKILMAGQGFDDLSQPPLYMKTTDEMLTEFDFLGEEDAYKAVIECPDQIQNQVDELVPVPQDLYTPHIPGAEDQITEMAYSKAKQLYGEPLPEIVKTRLEEELKSIVDQGYAVIYLISHKLVKKSLEDGYLVGSRGSVGSSLVATMCDITEVNPLPPHYMCPNCQHSEFIQDGSVGSGVDLRDKNCPHCNTDMNKDGYDIPFAVFMGFHGEKVPDIDLNFSGEYQPIAHEYTEELFGKEHVFKAGTIGTIAEKTAFGFVKGYVNDNGINCRQSEVNRLVSGCTGVKRTTGQHPGGLMIVPEGHDIHEFCPIQRPADDTKTEVMTTHFDYNAISDRLLKLDILGHDVPTIIYMLESITGLDPLKIRLDDPDTIKIFSSPEPLGVGPEDIDCQVGTLGIPEFGTRFVRQMLEDTKPQTFSELIRISGLSHGTDVWLNNAQDIIAEGIAELGDVISTRDDIMVYLMYKGVDKKDAFTIMEKVRKGKGLSDELKNTMKEAGVPDWYLDSCLKIKYLFPKAHAVAYTMMSFRIAYYKVFYPEAFYATFFSVKTEDFNSNMIVKGLDAVDEQIKYVEERGVSATPKEKSELVVLEVAREMFQRGVQVLPVSIYESDSEKFQVTQDGYLRPPLITIPGLGSSVAKQIVKAREEREFSSKEDLRKRGGVSKSVIEPLEEHGCLKDLPDTDQLTLF